MKTLILLLVSILIIVGFVSCNRTPDLTEVEVYKIVNEIIKDDTLPIYRVCWKFDDIELSNEYLEEFKKDDIEFIKRQRNIFRNPTITKNSLKWFDRRAKTFDYIMVDSICNSGIINHISFPLISADRQKVIIEFRENCNCMLGGRGGKDLYEKKNGHWKRTKSFNQWISETFKITSPTIPRLPPNPTTKRDFSSLLTLPSQRRG